MRVLTPRAASPRTPIRLLGPVCLAGLLCVATCAHAHEADVRVPTPLGPIHAKSRGVPAFVAGMPEYPHARVTSGDPDGDGADVKLKLPFFQMKMQALRYTSDDPLPVVLAYYRKRLAEHGEVKEENGGPHASMSDFSWRDGPDERSLAVESDGHVYMVAMRPQGHGCQFALISLVFEEQ